MYDYQNTEFEAFNKYLSQVDWGFAFSTCLSAIEFWKCFVNILHEGIMLFFPMKTVSKLEKSVYPAKIQKMLAIDSFNVFKRRLKCHLFDTAF